MRKNCQSHRSLILLSLQHRRHDVACLAVFYRISILWKVCSGTPQLCTTEPQDRYVAISDSHFLQTISIAALQSLRRRNKLVSILGNVSSSSRHLVDGLDVAVCGDQQLDNLHVAPARRPVDRRAPVLHKWRLFKQCRL